MEKYASSGPYFLYIYVVIWFLLMPINLSNKYDIYSIPSSMGLQAYHVTSKCCSSLIDSMDVLKTSRHALQRLDSGHTFHPTWVSPSQLTSPLAPRPRHNIHQELQWLGFRIHWREITNEYQNNKRTTFKNRYKAVLLECRKVRGLAWLKNSRHLFIKSEVISLILIGYLDCLSPL